MGLGIGLGRDWLSGRYAVPVVCVAFIWTEGVEEEKNTRQRNDIAQRREQEEEATFANATLDNHRFSANRPRPQTPLDSIKFVCKDLWPLLFRKQIDNLKTNHRGVFVLTDQRFQPISRVSVDRKAGVKAPEETLSRAQAVSFHGTSRRRIRK